MALIPEEIEAHRPLTFTTLMNSQPSDVRVLAVEGPAWSTAFFRDVWNNAEHRQKLLDFLSLIEAEPSLLGASAHLLAVGFRSD